MTDASKGLANGVTGAEVVELFRRVLRRELKVVAVGQSWNDVYAGDVTFRIGGYEIVIFNDCDELDYVDSVIAPDGRTGDFDDWFDTNTEPVGMMTSDESSQLEYLLDKASVVEPLKP